MVMDDWKDSGSCRLPFAFSVRSFETDRGRGHLLGLYENKADSATQLDYTPSGGGRLRRWKARHSFITVPSLHTLKAFCYLSQDAD